MSSDLFDKLMNFDSSNVGKKREVQPKAKKSDILLSQIQSAGFNMDQLEDVIREKGNQLIISIAGSGKTTALIFKIAYDITTGEATKVVNLNRNNIRVLDKIWVCTFLKSGADELRNKLAYWQNKFGLFDTSKSVTFSTLHAEFKRALDGLGYVTNIINATENSKKLKKVIEKLVPVKDGKPFNSDTMRDIESALTYTRNRLDEKRYNRAIYEDLNMTPSIIDAVLRDWKTSRFEDSLLDFEDLQEILYDECYRKNNEDVIRYLGERYAFIYIDEFQDTSQIQYELLKVYARGRCKKFVAIGDDDQTIYSWRGSYNKIITEEFAKDFNPTISKLSMNYRCPSNILKGIAPSLEMNQNRFKKELRSARSGGTLRFAEYSTYDKMVAELANLVYKDVSEGRSVAILCRVNLDGLMPALMLDMMAKFNYSISGDGMTLDSYMGKQVVGIAKLFTERTTPAVKSALSHLSWDKWGLQNIMKVCKNNKISFWEIPDNDLVYSCPDIARMLIHWKELRKKLGDIETLRIIYHTYKTSVLVKDTQYNIVFRSVISAVEAMLSIYKGGSVEGFIDMLEDVNERLQARKKKSNGSKVRIATVHEFKGKEADSVYIWNDSTGVFPHKDCDLFDMEELEEERRVHYIACTRAREISTIISKTGEVGLFVKEMDLSGAEILSGQVSGKLGSKDIAKEDIKDEEDEDDFTFMKASDYGEKKDDILISESLANDIKKRLNKDKWVDIGKSLIEDFFSCKKFDPDEDLGELLEEMREDGLPANMEDVLEYYLDNRGVDENEDLNNLVIEIKDKGLVIDVTDILNYLEVSR